MATKREILARKYVCPECHTEAHRPCRKRTPFSSGLQDSFNGGPMRGIHAKRKALVTPQDVSEKTQDVHADAITAALVSWAAGTPGGPKRALNAAERYLSRGNSVPRGDSCFRGDSVLRGDSASS